MNADWLYSLAENPWVVNVGWTLVHFVWQALLIAGLVALLLSIARSATSHAKYWIAGGGLAVMALTPVATFFILVSQPIENRTPLVDESVPVPSTRSANDIEPNHLPAMSERGLALTQANQVSEAATETGAASIASDSQKQSRQSFVSEWLVVRLKPWLSLAVVAWSLGVLLLATRLFIGLGRIWRWRQESSLIADDRLAEVFARLAERMKVSTAVRLLQSERMEAPAVIGWIRPVVLVPASMLSGLTPGELEAILAHELAHVRRYDYLMNLLQTMVETVLFYHPAVWWLSRRVRAERENCCDDIAVATCGNRLQFAQALARMEEMRCRSTQLAMTANGGSLISRIRRILAEPSEQSTRWWPAGAASLAIVLTLAGSMWLNSFASQPSPGQSLESMDRAAETKIATLDDDYALRKADVELVDSKSGLIKRVFTDIRLKCETGSSPEQANLNMAYSSVLPYSLIPARIAKSLGAQELGTIDFGRDRPPQPMIAQTIYDPASESTDPIKSDDRPTTITVNELTESDEDGVTIVPYGYDTLWLPDHLSFYGMNKTQQRRFTVVRIDRVDLGVGPAFGPVNALVLDDENSDFGILGTFWAALPRGKNGEGLWYAPGSGFHFMSGPTADPVTQDDPNVPEPPSRDLDSPLIAESSGDPDAPDRLDREGLRVIASHSYDQSRRESTGWVEWQGSRVPVDVGIEHDGIVVYGSLFYDVYAVDRESEKTLWHVPGAKSEPFWKTVSIVEYDLDDQSKIAVELFAVDNRTREWIYRYVDLRTGEEVPPPTGDFLEESDEGETAEPDDPIPQVVVVEREGDNITRAVMHGIDTGRSPAELLKHFQSLPRGLDLTGSITNMETIVSSEKPNYVLVDRMDADQVIFNLPEGAGLRAEFIGQRIEIEPQTNGVRVIVTGGRVQLIDAGGVIRADASPDGGAEQLVIDSVMANDEVVLTMGTQRIEPSPEYPHPPVQVVMNTETGAPADEEDPPHRAIRYEIQSNVDDQSYGPMKMKMQWRFELQRLAREAEAQTGQDGNNSIPDEQADDAGDPLWLDQARRLGDWRRGDRFDSRGFLLLAASLQKMDPEQRAAALHTIADQQLDATLIALCRLLFEAREGNSFRAPHWGEPQLVSYDQNPGDFPLAPIAWIADAPVLVVQGYDLSSEAEPAADYLEYCLKNCDWTSRSFASDLAKIDQTLSAATSKLVDAPFWGDRMDVDEWVEVVWIRDQLVPSIMLTVGKMEHVAAEIPVYSWNRAVGVKPETVVAELEQRGLHPNMEIVVIISEGAQDEWLREILSPLADAGYGHFVFIRWQQSRHPVDEPDLQSWLSRTPWGPPANEGGLRLRLSLEDRDLRVGAPLRLKLELQNAGDQPQTYDPQYYAEFRALRVLREDGQSDQFIGPTPQTFGEDQPIAPGQTVTLWRQMDARKLYLLDAGRYTLQVTPGRFAPATFPTSNTLTIEVQPGEDPPIIRVIKSLKEVKPADWKISSPFQQIFLSYEPTNLKRDASWIRVWFSPEREIDDADRTVGGEPLQVDYCGQYELGFLYVAAMPRAIELWPDYLSEICAAIEAVCSPIGDGVETQQDATGDELQPWIATGRVTDRHGNPIEGATVRAHCGAGTLRETGSAITGPDGRYELRFGPGIWFENRQTVQAATISVQLDGHFEKNLHRQGDRVAAYEMPEGEIGWGEMTADDLFLPGQTEQIDFVMLPATRLRGMVIDQHGLRPEGVRVSLTGDQLPPSSSVIDEVQTDANGEFEVTDIPTGYAFQIMVEPVEAKPPWLAWASPPVVFVAGDSSDTHVQYSIDDRPVDFSFQRLYLILQGGGVNWKTALADSADQSLALTWDGLSTERVVRAGMAYLNLGESDSDRN